jgi:DNA-binding XRE family transcriptional regulator
MTPDQLKAFRARLGLTQAQLAEKLGVERNTVNRWEMGLLPIRPLPLWLSSIFGVWLSARRNGTENVLCSKVPRKRGHIQHIEVLMNLKNQVRALAIFIHCLFAQPTSGRKKRKSTTTVKQGPSRPNIREYPHGSIDAANSGRAIDFVAGRFALRPFQGSSAVQRSRAQFPRSAVIAQSDDIAILIFALNRQQKCGF